MVFSNERKRGLLPIFILLIAECPFFSDGFLPPNKCTHYQQSPTACSWPNSFDQRRNDPVPTKVTGTTLHALTDVLAGVAVVTAAFGGWLYIDGAGMRERSRLREEEEKIMQALQEERARLAYIEPKEYWTEEELAPYDGSRDEEGPILLAADGLVFNVYKGRNFYLPGCEYHIFAGRDATRLLARNKVEEETEEEAKKPLNIADRAFLATWIYTFKNKYDIVGKLEGFDPESTKM
mmetsp:Transcript_4653/g.11163  ORF Transcript_4653/g.11163 Transcript_4653/m.11163 type:complete len:236 (-) Transcript_4653:527-1234(-)|eukprot:CAMPEP_0116078412 /NCGR_PEP_ID=MMETSP0327-20121206/590_1 /TAXON_ID=44447 /ORGANISM="Pseudo-nitzschia delicatissima, Strain B596" /LENGTH=235 /DNA_ID=CAMNT_0003568959 /DNA_START=27 /DNA_END=734 /DNA_ORIENTATION=-